VRRKARIDSNQPEIVKALRQIGATVATTHMMGRGFPDIIIGFKGKNYLAEIKDGSLVPSKRKLTDDELEFHTMWQGQIHVINSVDEAINLVT